MNKAKVKALRAAIEKAVAQVEQEWDVDVTVGNARFTNESVKFQFNVVEKRTDSNGQAVTVSLEQIDFERNCWKWGLQATDIGRQFFHNGKRFTLTGSKSRAHRYPIQATRSDGRTFKFTVDCVKGKLL